MRDRFATSGSALLVCALAAGFAALPAVAQSKKGSKPAAATATASAPQKMDEEYTKLIHEYLQDPRITTELVDHMPASDTVPSPLKFLGRIPGKPGELTYAKDIYRYYEALAKASPRAKFWKIGQTEEGRDQVILAIADEATIKDLDKYKDILAKLGDPRRITDEQAHELIKTGKPLYWANSGIHSPETGGPEMLIELAYRLIVEETPFIQAIRNNIITFITPVIEVDGREKEVDTYYFNKGLPQGAMRLPLMYWGKYVQHDNNRDGMGQYLKITQNFTKGVLEWHPTVLHDLHEAQSYLYVSTGTGPYNTSLDPIQIDEWWLLAQTEVMEMAKRGVPGVFTYGFYDGWVPNYLFWIAITHNSFGRFYEVQSYGPDVQPNLQLGATQTSREWFRPNPPLPSIKWGPRNNTNIQESALLIALNRVARDKELYLENYWMKNKRSIDKGKNGPTYAWLIPAGQRRKADAADMVNELRRQGVEVHQATSAFKAGNVDVAAGDYVVRGDQPYRTLADMYFSVQNYPTANPRPYDDTGWTMEYMRNVKLVPLTDKAVLDRPMTMLSADAKAAGGVDGSGSTLVIEHTSDNALMGFRYKNKDVKMLVAEDDFDLNGRKLRAGAFIIPNADRGRLEPMVRDMGLSAWAVSSMPSVKTHEMTLPRIGYVHSWSRTQDEGWVRAALDHYGVPYTYFADQKLREGNLRAKYDVIIFPHVGGNAQSMIAGIAKTGNVALPYKKTDKTPNLGAIDETDDIRGGMGFEGLQELSKFVEAGGTLISEGSTAALMAEYDLAGGVTVEHPSQLFARGSILRAKVADLKSPIAYGYDGSDLPVYFNQDPVLNASGGGGAAGGFGGFGGGGGGGFGGAAGAQNGQNVTPNAVPIHVSQLDAGSPVDVSQPAEAEAAGGGGRGGRGGRGGGGGGRGAAGGGGRGGFGGAEERPRVVVQFPANANDMLLSGTLAGGEALSGRAAAVDVSLGKGHIVMFALRPFWRWQSQGTYFLAFNAILNWNHLDAGKPAPGQRAATEAGQ
ncbi:MAG TPA: M14 family zinc carboxypeptidase [Bryobacteraceae bacterium]|nr:M14 family zinc carboxypeptidase [Bryobacteraceae bacterium]